MQHCVRWINISPPIHQHSFHVFFCTPLCGRFNIGWMKLTRHNAAWMMQGKVAEDRKLTSTICTDPKWLWAGVQHGQVESSWHRRISSALFVTVNNNCFLTIRVEQEHTSSQSLTFSSNLSNLRERSCVKTDGKIFNCVCRLQETIGILQEPLTLSGYGRDS